MDQLRATVAKEADLLERCAHPNIAYSYGICADYSDEDDPFVAIVMELYPEGNLSAHLKQLAGSPLRGAEAARLLEGIAHGLAHLHANGIVHKDLKPENVLLRKDDNGQFHAVLTDFGLSVDLAHSSRRSNISGGTVPYKSPEQLKPQRKDGVALKLTPKADIFSFGVIAWQLAMMQEPWEGETEFGVIDLVCNLGKRPEFPEARDRAWDQIVVLALLCFEAEPQDRPNAEVLARSLARIGQ